MNTTAFDNQAIAALLELFRDRLVCWKVFRVTGSLIYIEMGRHWTYRDYKGESVSIGSTSLSLDADDWLIRQYNKQVANAASVCDSEMPRISALFIGQRLTYLEFSHRQRKCRIEFSNDLHITLNAGPDDDDLCVLHLPDGSIIGCDATEGFQSDGSKSKARAVAYALETTV